MVDATIEAFRERLENLDWMEKDDRKAADQKVRLFIPLASRYSRSIPADGIMYNRLDRLLVVSVIPLHHQIRRIPSRLNDIMPSICRSSNQITLAIMCALVWRIKNDYGPRLGKREMDRGK